MGSRLRFVLGGQSSVPARAAIELRAFRWSDLEYVMEIERRGFPTPLTEYRMRQVLDTQGTVCTIAERSGSVAGFCIHQLGEQTIRLLGVAVHPAARRLGVGRALVARAKRGLELDRWRRMDTIVPDDALDQQLWLRAMGFRAVPDVKGRYIADGDMIRFRCEAPAVGGGTGGTGCAGGAGEPSDFPVE
jgi:ribosomal protein S18 acetylase RimI-like enzyme